MESSNSEFKPKYTIEEISNFDSYNNFMDASVELHKQSISLVQAIIDKQYFDQGEPIELDKEQAVIAGNLVRLMKLNISFLQNVCDSKIEIASILLRCIGESYVNTKFLISNNEENAIKNYIKYSLITEKELWNKIKENINERGGNIEHIEFRMNKSIERSFENSDFELDEVHRSSKWKSVAKRAKVVAGDAFYSIFYGMGSHSVHGNWQDILFYNLKKTQNGFKINPSWTPPVPQGIDAVVLMNLDLCEFYINNSAEDSLNSFLEIAEALRDYQISLIESHENFLSQNNNSR